MSEVFAAATSYPPVLIDYRLVARAKRLMRTGLDLHEVALALNVRVRDLDLSLWRHIGNEGWND